MGVSGSGKTSVGRELAQKLSAKFFDGDDFHPRSNIVKMASGMPLDDDDRAPWLERINDIIFSLNHKNERGVIVCSALKKCYRDQIRNGNQGMLFIFLQSIFDVILHRLEARSNHYMPASLLQSQFDTLEVPNESEPDVISVNADSSTMDSSWSRIVGHFPKVDPHIFSDVVSSSKGFHSGKSKFLNVNRAPASVFPRDLLSCGTFRHHI
ncbi:hypothetical protein EDD11_009567 [Mortierella claussenii]|nr:hypothetical protein EDD11_009567 [Mortierella claussenii]